MDVNRRTAVKGIGAGTATLLGGVGTAAASPPSEGNTIVEVAVENEFEVLAAAVTEAGLVDALSGNRQLTVFAPTDDAFNAAGITVDNVDQVDDEFLINVLTYHVTPGRRDAQSIVTADELPTLNGARIDADGTDPNGDQADIVATDIKASNGFVHVIDGVLLP
jgi:uncharacterized surface protein with fasciclin (FAS1) repeats